VVDRRQSDTSSRLASLLNRSPNPSLPFTLEMSYAQIGGESTDTDQLRLSSDIPLQSFHPTSSAKPKEREEEEEDSDGEADEDQEGIALIGSSRRCEKAREVDTSQLTISEEDFELESAIDMVKKVSTISYECVIPS